MSGIAVVGASESGIWTLWLLRNLQAYGYRGDIWLINPGRKEVFGQPCLASIDQVRGDISLGVVITSPGRAVEACAEFAARGVREILLISNGFRETGTPEGIAAEARLAEICKQNGIRLVGPNCVGFARFHEGLCAIAEPISHSMRPGNVSLISNSGALLSGLLYSLTLDGAGLDVCYSIGNGTAFDLADAIEHAGTRETTKVVCALVEAIPSKQRLAAAIRSGRERGCEYVFLLLGQSESAKAIAASHTGAVLGEGRLTRAWLESEGVAVVSSVVELSHTAALMSKIGPMHAERGVMVVSGSGGACGLGIDALVREGVPLACLSEPTVEVVRKLLPVGAFIGNPLDIITGTPEERAVICRHISADPGVGLLLEPFAVVWPDDSEVRLRHREFIDFAAAAVAENGIPYVVSSTFPGPLTGHMEAVQARPDIVVQAGVEVTARALRHLYQTRGLLGRKEKSADHAHKNASDQSGLTIGEAEGRVILQQAGMRVVPGVHAQNAEEVIAAAKTMRGPWVVKIGNSGIAHKGRVGGVQVGLCNDDELREACRSIADSAIRHGVAKSAGEVSYLLQQMVIGPEMLVAAIRDPIVGPSVTVGIGGWAAEAGHIFFTVPLPVEANAFAGHVAGSALAGLLNERQSGALIEVLEAVGTAFVGDAMAGFDVLECNPVILTEQGGVVADVLILRTAAGKSTASH